MSLAWRNWLGILAIGLCTVSPAGAQSGAATLSGVVVDQSGGALPGVQVIAVGLASGLQRQATSDDQGAFIVPMLPAGNYSVTAQLQGFAPAQVNNLLVPANEEVRIRLELTLASLNETVSVQVAPRPVTAAPSTIELSPLEVRSVAGATENVFRVLQTLPGVTPVNDFDSRLSVRGGGPDQNLTMMDGVEVHNPYRLFGLTSAFNPETVGSFELITGGFSPKYGDRMSSILVIENRDGSRQKPVAGSTSLTLTDGNVVAEGALPGGNGSWLVTGRRTYYDLIAEPILGNNLPGFSDLQLKATWEPTPGRRVTIFGLGSRERTDLHLDDTDLDSQGEHAALLSSTNNDLAAISFASPLGRHASSKTTLSWYRNRETTDFDGGFRDGARRSNRPDADATPLSAVDFTRGIAIRDVAVRQELTITPRPSHLIEAGFETHALATGWDWRIAGDRNADQANGSSAFGGAGLPSLLHSTRSTWRVGGWLTDRWTLTPRFTVEPGVRLDWSGIAGEVIASPRMALVARLTANTRLRVAGGLFTQSPGYEKLLQSDYFFDLSNANTLGLRSERAWHALVGLERTIGRGVITRVEGYYKDFDRLIVGRMETPGELAARVATYDFPSALSDHVPSAPHITSIPGNAGTGRAYGVELFAARPATSSTDRLSGWMSYTWGRAKTTAYDRTYVSDYDRPHALNVVGSYRLSRLLELGATVRVQSGLPFTVPVGVRVAAVEDRNDGDGDGNLTELVPQRDSEGLPVWFADYGSTGNLNSGRLPLFARVDLRVTFRPRWQNSRWLLYVEAINALNRRNASEAQTELRYDPGSDRPRVTTIRDGFPLLPSFGVRFRF